MKKGITAIPGSLMLIPMAISALVCTYYPFLSRLKSPASESVGCCSGSMSEQYEPRCLYSADE